MKLIFKQAIIAFLLVGSLYALVVAVLNYFRGEAFNCLEFFLNFLVLGLFTAIYKTISYIKEKKKGKQEG